jgi:hypothetical protein
MRACTAKCKACCAVQAADRAAHQRDVCRSEIAGGLYTCTTALLVLGLHGLLHLARVSMYCQFIACVLWIALLMMMLLL